MQRLTEVISGLWPPAAAVPLLLERELGEGAEMRDEKEPATTLLVEALLTRRREFGITRVGSIAPFSSMDWCRFLRVPRNPGYSQGVLPVP